MINKFFKKLWAWTCKRFDKALYKGGFKQFIWLVSILILCSGIGIFLSSFFGTSKWRVVELLLDPGSFSGSSTNGGDTIFQLIMTLIGAVLFTSLLINAVGNFIERRIDRFQNGKIAYEVDEHILIIGARSMLVNLVKTLLENEQNAKRDIVILTSKNAEDVRAHLFSEISQQKARNIYIYYGSCVLKETLKKLDAHQTTSIYILGEDDEPAHDSICLQCYELLKNICDASSRFINCYMVLDHLTSIQLFYRKQDVASYGKLRLSIVNSLESIAQHVLIGRNYRNGETYPALDRNGIHIEDDRFVHLVIVGMSEMGYAMAATAAHVCHFPNFQRKRTRTKISFIQTDIYQEMNFFIGRYYELMNLSYWQYINYKNPTLNTESYPNAQYVAQNTDRKGFVDIEWEFIDSGIETPQVRNYLEKCASQNNELLTIAICGNSPEVNASTALFLPNTIIEKQIPIFVYQPGGDQMIRLVKDTSLYASIFPFGMRTEAFDKQYHERLLQAQRIKYIYRQGTIISSIPADDELTGDWYETQYAFQQSNVYAANSIPFKLRSLSNVKIKLSEEDIDMMAKTEHCRWNTERLLMGFKPYKLSERLEFLKVLSSNDQVAIKDLTERLVQAKTKFFKHKDIAPYDELLESSRKYDRIIVENIFNVLKND